MVDTWHPKRVNKGSRQVSIPAEVLNSVGIAEGDDVYVRVNPEDPRSIVIVPAELLHIWVEKGRRSDDGLDT